MADDVPSPQGELLAILEDAVREPAMLTPDDVLAEVRRMGLVTPSESVAMIRADRAGRPPGRPRLAAL